MNRVISFIISATMFLSFMPVYADNSISSVDYPTEGAELGYLFSLKSEPNTYFNADDYEGIELASAMANIYYSDTIEHIKAIENIVDIDMVVENWSLDSPEPTVELMNDDNFISAFFADDIDTEITAEQTNDEAAYPNDPLLERQWYYEAVKAQTFRDNNIDGTGIKVGIIDSGLTKEFKTFHDFEGVDIQTGINICAKLDKNEELLYDTSDNQTHGTSVASIICTKSNNNHGIAGLTDGCTVIPYKVEDKRCSTVANSGYADIVAIDEAYQDGCDVLNISRGSNETPQSAIDMENTVINKATQNGMIVVVAVGNDGRTTNAISYPAACDNVIGVGSVAPTCDEEVAVIDATTEMIKPESEYTANDTFFTGWLRRTVQNLPDNAYKKTSSSTANESVFVCASGLGITTADPLDASSWTDKVSSFCENSGTSFATPIVASAAIGVKQMRPYVDTDMFKEILRSTVVDLEDEGYDINTGYGMVNFERIYDYVSQMPLTAPERTPEVSIDYENEQLIGFPINREYTINGENVTISKDGTFPINEEWLGNTISIVKKASSESYEDSEPQEIAIPLRPELPDTVYGTNYGIANDNHDKISYMPTDGEEWINTYSALELPNGTYLVKLASTSTTFSGTPKTIYVGRQNIGVEIDYKNETLVNFENGKSYTINGHDVEINNQSYPIDEEWFGTTISIVKKASNSNDIDIMGNLDIPNRPAAPILSGDKGKIIGTTSDMQYCKQDGKQWIGCSDGTTLLGSTAGVYQVRVKQSNTNFAGEIAIVQVGLPIPTAEIDYKNETLKTFETGESYTINGHDVEIENRTCPIDEEWFGTTVSIVRKASSKYMNDSEPQELVIPARTAAPVIDLLSDNTVNLTSNILYKEENSNEWKESKSNVTITLEQGKSYVFKVKYTENSFASEVRQITVQFAPIEQYEIETSIIYDYDSRECTYEAVNNTIWTINTVGIIAVYSPDGVLKHLETIDTFPADGVKKKLNFTLLNGDTVKWFLWDSLQSMQPRDKVKLSEYIVKFDETE